MLERARHEPGGPDIAFAKFHIDGQYLEKRLTDGRRLLVPREELGELKHATDAQAEELIVLNPATELYWPQLDDGWTCELFWNTGGGVSRRRWRRKIR